MFCSGCGSKNEECQCEGRSRSRDRTRQANAQARSNDGLSDVLATAGVDDPLKRSKLSETIGGLLEAVTDRALAKNDAVWEKRLPDILAAQDAKVDAKITVSEERTKAIIHKLQSDVDEIKNKLTGMPAQSSAPPGRVRDIQRNFTPRKVWIKGYIIDWKVKDASSLSKHKVMEWVAEVVGRMGDGIRNHIDMEATRKYATRVMFTKFALHLKDVTDREVAWSVKNEIERIVGEGDCLINDLKPRVTIDPSPEMKPFIDQGGKLLGILQTKGVPRQDLRPEWGPPVRIYDNRKVEHPVCIGEYDVKKGWDIHEAPLQGLVPGLKAEDLKVSLQ